MSSDLPMCLLSRGEGGLHMSGDRSPDGFCGRLHARPDDGRIERLSFVLLASIERIDRGNEETLCLREFCFCFLLWQLRVSWGSDS